MRSTSLLFTTLVALIFSFSVRAQLIIAKDPASCLYGLRDASGKWLVAPAYTTMLQLWRTTYKVSLGEKYGVIDQSGKIVVPMEYDDVYNTDASMSGREDFPETTAFFQSSYTVLKKGLYGLVDSTGKIILPCIFRQRMNFWDGICVCPTTDGKISIADKTGVIGHFPDGSIVQPARDRSSPYSTCRMTSNRFLFALAVQQGKRKVFQSGICDEYGNIVIPCIYDSIKHNVENVMAISGGAQRVFSNNKNLKLFSNGKQGIFSFDGKTIIPCHYNEIRSVFTDSSLLFICRENNSWSLYSSTGELLNAGPFQFVQPEFSFFKVKKNNKWGVIDLNGKEKEACRFDTIFTEFFSKDSIVFFCRSKNSWNILFSSDSMSTDAVYENVERGSTSYYFKVKKRGHWGAIDWQGKEILPFAYDTIFVNENCDIFWSPRDVTGLNTETKERYDDQYVFLGVDYSLSTVRVRNYALKDSTWFLVQDPFAVNYGESFVQDWRLIRKTSNGKLSILSIYPIDASDSVRFYFSSGNRANCIFSSDGKFFLDSIPGIQLSFFDKQQDGNLIFETRTMTGKIGMMDGGGKIILDTLFYDFQPARGDTVWVKDSPLPIYGNNFDCTGSWNLVVLSTGKFLLPRNAEFIKCPGGLEYVMTEKEENSKWVMGTTSGFGLFDIRELKFLVSPIYRTVDYLDANQNFFAVTTFSGKSGIVDVTGKIVCDTAFDKIITTGSTANLYYSNYSFQGEEKNFSFLLISKNEKMVFDQNGAHQLDDHYRDKLLQDIMEYPPYKGYWESRNDDIRIAVENKTSFENWQKELLFDSLFLAPYIIDYRNWVQYREDFDYSWVSCGNKWQRPQWNQTGQIVFSTELSYSGDYFISFRRTGKLPSWFAGAYWSDPRQLIYLNYAFHDNQAQLITLDSLFDGNAWKPIVISELFAYLNTHPEIESPCFNADAYCNELQNRFLFDEKALYIYPEWKNHNKPYAKSETQVTIPWEKLKPYLKKDFRKKMGI